MNKSAVHKPARALLLVASGSAPLLATSPLMAAVVSWSGTNRVLGTASYWTGGNLPGSADEAYFGTLSGSPPSSLAFKGTSTTPSTISLDWGSVVFDSSSINSSGPLDIDASLNSTGTGAATLTLNGDGVATDDIIQLSNNVTGLVDFRGNDATAGSPLTLALAGVGQVDVVNAAATLESDGVVTGSNGITKVGAGLLYLYNGTGIVNTFTGGVTTNGGTVAFNNGNGLGNSSNTTTINNGTLEYLPKTAGSSGQLVATRSISLGSASSQIDVTPGNTLTMLGSIVGSGALNKIDTGTFIITSGGYSGATNVSGGALFVNGAVASAAATTVSSGATLGGNGSLAGALAIASGGTLMPGNSDSSPVTVGTLSAGATTLGSGSTLDIALDSDTTSSDLLDVTGSASLGSATLDLSDLGSTTLAGPTVFTIVQASGGVTGTFNGLAQGASVTVGNNTYTIDYNADGGDAVTLSIGAVPEPACLGLLAFTGAGLIRRRRR